MSAEIPITPRSELAPSTRELLTIALAAALARVLLSLALITIAHIPPSRIPRMRDSHSYLDYARGIEQGRSGFAELDPYDRRLFPGFPLLIAAVHQTGIPIGIAALALNWTAVAASAVLTALLFQDRRIGWAMALLTPSYILYTTIAMSEAVLILLTLFALFAAMRGHAWAGGVWQGLAILVRPLGFPAAIGYALARRHRFRDVIAYGIGATLVFAAGLLFMRLWSGSFVPGWHVYATNPRAYGGGEVFTWPFHSLIVTPGRIPVAPWKVAYIWTHVLLVLAGCLLSAREAFAARLREPLATLCAVWLLVNTAVVLCIGSKWGFQEFHRFILPALPPLFYSVRRWLPRGGTAWCGIGIISIALAFWGASSGK
jgi:hypothetical protein